MLGLPPHLHTRLRSRNSFEQFIIFLFVSFVVLTKLWSYFLLSKVRQRTHQLQIQPNGKDRVQLWIPHNNPHCDGTFNVQLEAENITKSTVLTIREAIVDRRFISLNDAERNGIVPPFKRILFLMTALPHPAMNGIFLIDHDKSENKSAHLVDGFGNISNAVNVTFEYLILDGRCQRVCGRWGHCKMREWRAIVTLTPFQPISEIEFENYLTKLSDSNHKLIMNIPITIILTGEKRSINVELSLSCIALVSKESKIPHNHQLPRRADTCSNATGAVALAGAPVFGPNSTDIASWKRIAHYAARHMYGHTWFDTVVIAIHPRYSFAEIKSICSKSPKNLLVCKQNLVRKNVQAANEVRQVVENELIALQVPKEDWHRIYITSFCGLGVDFDDKEKGWPCQLSHQGGQKVWGYFSFTAFSPYHKWASNFDLDEFLVDELAFNRTEVTNSVQRYQSAYNRFSLLEQEAKKPSFYATWLDFQIDEADAINFTRKVMKGHQTGFSSLNRLDTNFTLRACYGQGGKVITSCKNTVSFMIHYSLNIKRGNDMSNPKCEPNRNPERRTIWNETQIYTYHARRYSRQGSCLYNPDLRN